MVDDCLISVYKSCCTQIIDQISKLYFHLIHMIFLDPGIS
jgi:hypothetical protein